MYFYDIKEQRVTDRLGSKGKSFDSCHLMWYWQKRFQKYVHTNMLILTQRMSWPSS